MKKYSRYAKIFLWFSTIVSILCGVKFRIFLSLLNFEYFLIYLGIKTKFDPQQKKLQGKNVMNWPQRWKKCRIMNHDRFRMRNICSLGRVWKNSILHLEFFSWVYGNSSQWISQENFQIVLYPRICEKEEFIRKSDDIPKSYRYFTYITSENHKICIVMEF